MARINTIECESVQVGVAPTPPIAGVDLWPSLDPTVPFTLQANGINNFLALTNQIGIFNGIGLQSITGLSNLLGFKTGVGGQLNVEPTQDNVTPTSNSSSPNGNLWGPWKKNGSSICVAPCSDQAAKKDVEPLANSLEKVLNLRGVSFDWDENVVPQRAKEEDRQIGLIAQEVEKIVPEVVRNETIESQTLKSIRYENLVALLIEGMKEQQEQINSLKETVQQLSTKLAECCS